MQLNQKIAEEMWCYNCQHEWHTDDYFNCNVCPKCNGDRIYRCSGYGYFYAHLERNPEEKDKLLKSILDAKR
jgi:Zn finger protein HypA/HybF involved in hydrogenase expression